VLTVTAPDKATVVELAPFLDWAFGYAFGAERLTGYTGGPLARSLGIGKGWGVIGHEEIEKKITGERLWWPILEALSIAQSLQERRPIFKIMGKGAARYGLDEFERQLRLLKEHNNCTIEMLKESVKMDEKKGLVCDDLREALVCRIRQRGW
jgi:hypothetical protein